MAGEENETKDEKAGGAPASGRPRVPGAAAPVPGARALQVTGALARAREAAKADRARKGGRGLALLPVAIAVFLLLLMMPRATLPDVVPLPIADGRVLRSIVRADDARASAAEATRLPSDIVLVGTALRVLSGADARGADDLERIDAHRRLDSALRDLRPRATLSDDLVALRALQTRHFLDALASWEKSGETSEDFVDLASSFVMRATTAGWVTGRHVVLDENERRVAFKTFWNVLAGVDARPELAITLDEQRTLFAFYIKHPHPPESNRLALETDRRLAITPEACARVNQDVLRQSELWLADKLKKLGELDSTYPTAYALGVAYFRAGRTELAVDAFTAFIAAHPDGAYSLLARNHLKALLASGSAR